LLVNNDQESVYSKKLTIIKNERRSTIGLERQVTLCLMSI
jgi:hypothetical protein